MTRRGLTLIEVVVAFSLFSIIGLLLALAFRSSLDVYRNVSGSTDSKTVLGKAQAFLQRDLEKTAYDSVRVSTGLSSLGPLDSDVLWFLSAENPTTGQFERKGDGTPFWQCNVLYYAAVPDNHSALFGQTCSGGADTDGYEVQCPHKVLIRKLIDNGPATDLVDESTEETLMTPAEINSHVVQPDGYDASFGGTGLLQVSPASTNLLAFRADLSPDPQYLREIRIQLAAVSTANAQREVEIGQVRLDDSRHSKTLLFSIFPRLR